MLFKIHATVQDAHDVDPGFDAPIEQHMRAGAVLAIALSDLIAGPTLARVIGNSFDSALQEANVLFGLSRAPPFSRVVLNILEVGAGTR